MKTFGFTFVLASLFVASCGGEDLELADEQVAESAILGRGNAPGGLYLMSNEVSENRILAYARASDGSLTSLGSFSTGGLGSGNGLGSQGAVVLHLGRKLLLTVNPGSDQVSSFRVQNDGTLVLASVVSSGGSRPVSVTAHAELVYVLNGAGAGSISGFRLDANGVLSPIAGSTRPLSGGDPTAPAQIAFTPGGGLLIVTEKATNLIDTYSVLGDGTTDGPIVTASNGVTPFGFEFAGHDRVIISEAFGGAPGASALSSYRISSAQPSPVLISGSIATSQTAACWVAVTQNKRFAYATNTGSGTISGYNVSAGGTLQLFASIAAAAGRSPLDLALSKDGRYLYAINGGTDDISGFRVEADGALTAIAGVTGLPATALGLAVR